jgi:indoleamine 2,3-dioxygenase
MFSDTYQPEASRAYNFLQEMRRYMPGPHARFLELISTKAIRNYVLTFAAGHPINSAYNEAIASLTEFRNKHIQLVTRYVILPSKISAKDKTLYSGVNLATASLRTENSAGEEKEYYGTGGTTLLPFLKGTRDETRDTTISSTIFN